MASSFVKRAGYVVTSEEDIAKIPDVKTAVMLLKAWGLETKGLKTKEQALQRLLDRWKETSDEQQKQSNEKINSYLTESLEKLGTNTEKLIVKFDSMVKFYKQLPLNHQKSICDSCENIEETSRIKIQSMKNKESVLVVAGEIGTGQTSFINLLMQTDILPVDEKGCTKTYCELSLGTRPKATLYSRSEQSNESTTTVLDMENPENKEALHNFIKCNDATATYEKVVIEFPFQFLEHHMRVFDIPDNIDTTLPLENIIADLPSNIVYLYVTDISKPDSLQPGKIQSLIQRVSSISKPGFTYDDIIVVCNKCDLIPEDQLDHVKLSVIEEIQRSCPELQKKQIVFLSVKEEKEMEKGGAHSEDFQILCKDIHNTFLRKMENNLINEYRWLSKVLKRALYTLKVSKLNSNKTLEQRRESMAQLEIQIEKFEKESKLIIARLHEEIDMEVDRLYSNITDYLKSTDLKASMSVWLERECPKPERKWKSLKSSAENAICDKLREKLNEWEESKCIKEKIQKQIMQKFSQEVELMEEQMRKIATMLACGDSAAVVNLHKSFKKDSPLALRASPPTGQNQGQKDKTSRLSDYVCAVGGFDKDVKKEIKSIFKKYKKETCVHQMFRAADIYVNCLLKSFQLKGMIAKYVKRFSKDINKIAKMIPDLIVMDKQLMKTLEAEVMETKETIFSIPEHLRRCLVLQGELDLFYVYEMLQLDYRMRDLEWDEKKILGVGSFASVYKGLLNTGDGGKIEVAIKVFKDPLQTNNVSEMLLEDETLRELNHDNIIKYYGATIMQKGKPQKTYWVMIMASCFTNLKDVYLDKKSSLKENNPGKTTLGSDTYEKARESMIRYTIQICAGLQYLHSKKLVHRDLKLENILVTKEREVKMTDVGLTKPEEDISGTFVGSPVYMAPEIHEQKTIYGRKADIYSLGMMLWEMWYGKCVNDELDGQVRGRLSVEIRKGKRPTFKSEPNTKPPDEWIELIEKCWDQNPKFRPKAAKIAEFFKNQLETTPVYYV